MADLYSFDLSGDPEDRARHEAERDARRAPVRARYDQRIVSMAGVDEITADLVLATQGEVGRVPGQPGSRGGGSRRERRTAIAEWLAAHPGVTADRTVLACPEVWEGTVDSHSFFFRERGGSWRIEIDLEPDGRFANRVVGTSADGELLTEPVELTSGPVIAQGDESNLGDDAVAHLAFIVDTVRTHLARAACIHERAKQYCPSCGERVAALP